MSFENISTKTIAWIRLSRDKYHLFISDDKVDEANFGYQNFFDSETTRICSRQYVLSFAELLDFLSAYWKVLAPQGVISDHHDSSNKADLLFQQGHVNEDAFEIGFSLIQERILSGQIKKAVPILVESFRFTPQFEQILNFVKSLDLLNTPQVYVYGVLSPTVNILGATPELLFEVKEGRLQTMALAGTLNKSEAVLDSQNQTQLMTQELQKNNEKNKLLSDQKEMYEHKLVVHEVSSQLEQICDYVQVGQTFVQELATLYHLKTEISAQLKIQKTEAVEMEQLLQIIKVLHPTPALGVFPKKDNMDWFRSLPEQHSRGLFGAPICFKISAQHAICLVAIRNFMWDNSKSWITTGCGVVQDSVCSKELLELKNKRTAVKKSLGIL